MTSMHRERPQDNLAEIGARDVGTLRRGDALAMLDLLAPGAVFDALVDAYLRPVAAYQAMVRALPTTTDQRNARRP